MAKGSGKLVNISESSAANSSRTTDCPECNGEAGNKECAVCRGSGEVTISKLNRLKKNAQTSSKT